MTVRRFAYISLVVAVIALIVVVVQRTLIAAVRVDSAAMSPTLAVGDVVAAWRSASVSNIKRGDLVVLRVASNGDATGPAMFPRSGGELVVRRVVGLPSEGIEGNQSGIRVYTPETAASTTVREPYVINTGVRLFAYTELRDDEMYVLEDNRGAAEVVRATGAVPVRAVIGVVRWQMWPLSDLGSVGDMGKQR